jgi:hypothetical protein
MVPLSCRHEEAAPGLQRDRTLLLKGSKAQMQMCGETRLASNVRKHTSSGDGRSVPAPQAFQTFADLSGALKNDDKVVGWAGRQRKRGEGRRQ